MGPYTNPTVSDFQAYFIRDFPYGTNLKTSIVDQDITNAMVSVVYSINQGLYPDQISYNLAFNNLTAHFLVLSIRSSSQGLVGQFNFLQNSKGAGGVSESFHIPDEIAKDPIYSVYTKTNYGLAYLMQVLPLLRGQMFSVCGVTKP